MMTKQLKNQIVRFIIVGSCSTAVNYAIFYVSLYFLHIHYLFASSIGYISGFGIGYLSNRNWTFVHHKALNQRHRELFRYFIMNITSLSLSLLSLHFLVDILLLPAWLSNIMALGVSTTSNFIGSKWFVFSTKP